MTMNIEQRTKVAVDKYEKAADKVEAFAETDSAIPTPSGIRKSFPKLSREIEQAAAQQLVSQNQQFQDRFNTLSAKAWAPNDKVTNSLQVYTHTDVAGVERSYLPNPNIVETGGFITGDSFADDLAKGRFEEESILTRLEGLRQQGDARGWGLKMDGTDETELISKIINILHNRSFGQSILLLPAGTLCVSGFYVPATVELKGAGRKTIIKPNNKSGSYAISASANSRLSCFRLDGSESLGIGLQVSNNCMLRDIDVHSFFGTETENDGTGLMLDGSWASSFERINVKQCVRCCAIGKVDTSLENNANTFYGCGFEYSIKEGFLVRKGAQTTLLGCWFGHHGIEDGDTGYPAFSCVDPHATVSLTGFYSEWCDVSVNMEGRTLIMTNGRSSGNVVIKAGQSVIQGLELFGYGGKITAPAGGGGYAIVIGCIHDQGYDVAPELNDPEGRISLLGMGDDTLLSRQGVTIYGGAPLRLNGGSSLEINKGSISLIDGDFGVSGGDAHIGGGDVVIIDNDKGLILKSKGLNRYRLKVDDAGKVITELVKTKDI